MSENEAELRGEIRALDEVLRGLASEEQTTQCRAIITSVQWMRDERAAKLRAAR